MFLALASVPETRMLGEEDQNTPGAGPLVISLHSLFLLFLSLEGAPVAGRRAVAGAVSLSLSPSPLAALRPPRPAASFAPPRRATGPVAVRAATAASNSPAAATPKKRVATGLTKPRPVSPALQAVVGAAEIPRTEALKMFFFAPPPSRSRRRKRTRMRRRR
uniref:Uncharacterized protein n=1 Tax=Oryza rufipogon TaxID=4529 RepID=A0A0E0MX84_ORYRU